MMQGIASGQIWSSLLPCKEGDSKNFFQVDVNQPVVNRSISCFFRGLVKRKIIWYNETGFKNK
jgi:hypothetical protein